MWNKHVLDYQYRPGSRTGPGPSTSDRRRLLEHPVEGCEARAVNRQWWTAGPGADERFGLRMPSTVPFSNTCLNFFLFYFCADGLASTSRFCLFACLVNAPHRTAQNHKHRAPDETTAHIMTVSAWHCTFLSKAAGENWFVRTVL